MAHGWAVIAARVASSVDNANLYRRIERQNRTMRTLVHLSDLHFGRVDPAIIGPLIETIKTIKPDLVAVSGDLTQRARSEQFQQARDFLGHLVRGKAIRLEIDPVRRDPSKRLLAYVYAGDTFVNLELIRQGQAAVSTGRPSLKYAEDYQKAQIEAQEAGRGIWEAKHLLK